MDVYTIIILVTLVSFIALAVLLLAPVYIFLDREEKLSQQWTDETVTRRARTSRPDPTAES